MFAIVPVLNRLAYEAWLVVEHGSTPAIRIEAIARYMRCKDALDAIHAFAHADPAADIICSECNAELHHCSCQERYYTNHNLPRGAHI